jgi:membrane protease YdiL (CAAX protease family)
VSNTSVLAGVRAWLARAERHPLPLCIALHLVPGALIVLADLAIGFPLARWLGYPPLFGHLLAALIALFPVQLGTLYWLGRERNGRLSLDGIVRFRERLPARQMAAYVLVLFAWAVLGAATIAPVVSGFVFDRLFFWVPEWLLVDDLRAEQYARSAVLVTLLLNVFVGGIAIPVVEELYFRGYLLPRMGRLRGWAPVLHLVLFALYHLWSPWRALERILLFLPAAYIVWRKRSIAVSIWLHCLGNTVGALLSLGAVLASGAPQG